MSARFAGIAFACLVLAPLTARAGHTAHPEQHVSLDFDVMQLVLTQPQRTRP